MEIPLDEFPETRKRLQAEVLRALKDFFCYLDEMLEYYLAELTELNARNEHEKIYNTTAEIKSISSEIKGIREDQQDWLGILLALLECGPTDYMASEKIEAIIEARRVRQAAESASRSPAEELALVTRRRRGRPGIVAKTAISRVKDDLASGRLTVAELGTLPGKEFEYRYGLSHSVAVEVRKKVLAEHTDADVSGNVPNLIVQFPAKKSTL